MKVPVDKAATVRVLAGIAEAVRPVEMARTAAAVERVLATASVAHGPWPYAGAHLDSYLICQDAGVEPGRFTYCDTDCPDGVRCSPNTIPRTNGTPGLAAYFDALRLSDQQRCYAPEVVSPHVFGAGR